MPSTYSPSLRIELIGEGEQDGIWGQTTNNNLGALIEQAITGITTVDVTAGNVTLTSFNGTVDEARSAVLIVNGSNTVDRNVVIPDEPKTYIVTNNTNKNVGIKTTTGTAYLCTSGTQTIVYCDGSNVVRGSERIFAKGPTGVTSFTGTTFLGAIVAGSTSATQYSGIDFGSTVSTTPIARIAAIPGASGSLLQFGTTNNYTNGITNTAMTINTVGGVFLGGNTALTNINLNAGKNVTGGTNAFGVVSNGQIQTDVTGIAQYFNAGGNQIVGTTTSQLRYYGTVQTTISGTVSNQYGFYADASLTGGVNNYGFYGNIAAATGRYNFYANGTADNVFVGTTSLGGAVGSEALRASFVSSSVNYMQVQGGTTGNGPTFTSQGTDTNIYMNFVAKGTGAFEFKSSGVRQFAIGSVPSAVNFVLTYGSITGNNAVITVDGSDTNIGITLAPKGTGNVSFGTFTSNADAPITGYITIKDQAGAVRKLAVIA